MPTPAGVTRVPVPDLCCLWAEGRTTPMNIALIGRFGPLPGARPGEPETLQAVREHVAARLHRAPMLRRVLQPTRLGEGTPVWVDDQRFDIAAHVVAGMPEGPFLDWCAQQSIVELDRTRPLWRMSVVPDAATGGFGLLVVLHHVVADGLRGVALVAGLLDSAPGAQVAAPAWSPVPPPPAGQLRADNFRRLAIRAGSTARALPAVRRRLPAWVALAREARTRPERPRLAGPIGPGRRVVVVRRPVSRLRETAHALGVTINDLLLAAVTDGLRDLLLARDVDCAGAALRASVPVRAHADESGGFLVVPLPVGVADPAQRLRLIRAETTRRKERADDGITALLSMPASLAHLGVAWARRSASSHIDLYVTNVPGPATPLYLAGARLREALPLAPLVAGVPLAVTALSYDGVLAVSVLVDDSWSDLPTLVAGMQRGLDASALAAVRG